MPSRLKVLMSAYACEPGKGSESAGGWNQVLQIARFHEVWVLTRANNRGPIEQDPLSKDPNIHWVYYDLPWMLRFWKKGGRGIQLYYFLWQIGIFFIARNLQKKIKFNLTHHFTLVRYWTPSFLSFLPTPMIFGPVGGGESAPHSFYKTFGWRGRIYEWMRDLIRFIAENDPLARLSVQRAVAVIATTEQTAERVRKMGAQRVIVSTSFAMTTAELDDLKTLPKKTDAIFRVISMGRLLHWKGFHLGLQAFAKFHKTCPDSEYWIVNTGPELNRLKALARQLGIEDCVTFLGKLPSLSDVHAKLGLADVLVHPSLHDSFGNVCLESLAAGKPVICLDLGGPAMQVTPECGFKISAESPEAAIEGIRTALETLYRDPDLKSRLGQHGQQRATTAFFWDDKGSEMNRLYRETVIVPAAPHLLLFTNGNRRLRVLMSAYACEPGKGSEPEVGWQWALQMARFHDVTVLTRFNNRPSIDRELEVLRGKQPVPTFAYHEESTFLLGIKDRLHTTKLYYLLWQRSARSVVADLHAAEPFDLFHHVTFAGVRYPAAIWGHGVSCIWGPIGGAESVPLQLLPWSHFTSLVGEIGRNTHNLLQTGFLQVLSKRARASTVTLVSTIETQRAFSAFGFDAQLMPTIGLNTAQIPPQPHTNARGHLKLLFVGNIITLKGVDLAVRALKESGTNATFTLVGDGNFMPAMRRLVRKLGLENQVTFLGRISRQSVMALYSEFDVFLFPSLHDTGGYAVIEAMANELPVICLDCGGPAVATHDGCGVKIPLGPPRKVISRMAAAIKVYDQNRDLVRKHGHEARKVILEDYEWERKGEHMNDIYKKAVTTEKTSSESAPYTGITPATNAIHWFASLRGFASLILLLLLIGASGFFCLSKLKRIANNMVEDTLPGLFYAGQANAYLGDSSRTLLYVATDDLERRTNTFREILILSERTSGFLEKYKSSIYSSEDLTNYNTLMTERANYTIIRNHVIELADAGKRSEAMVEFNERMLPAHARVKHAGDRLFEFNIQQGKERGRSIMLACTITQVAVAIIGVVVFVLGFFIGLFR